MFVMHADKFRLVSVFLLLLFFPRFNGVVDNRTFSGRVMYSVGLFPHSTKFSSSLAADIDLSVYTYIQSPSDRISVRIQFHTRQEHSMLMPLRRQKHEHEIFIYTSVLTMYSVS